MAATVFVLEHVHEFAECGHDDVKGIGIFTTRALAEAALERARRQPGFRDLPEGFVISEYELDSDEVGWSKGLVSIRPGEYLPDDKSFREYIPDLESTGRHIYLECSLCGSACPTTGVPENHPWQCSCGNLSVLNARRTAKGGNKTVRAFRLK